VKSYESALRLQYAVLAIADSPCFSQRLVFLFQLFPHCCFYFAVGSCGEWTAGENVLRMLFVPTRPFCSHLCGPGRFARCCSCLRSHPPVFCRTLASSCVRFDIARRRTWRNCLRKKAGCRMRLSTCLRYCLVGEPSLMPKKFRRPSLTALKRACGIASAAWPYSSTRCHSPDRSCNFSDSILLNQTRLRPSSGACILAASMPWRSKSF
jgi:hypothetical protein